MGTRALLIFHENNDRVVIYKHWDGYPENVLAAVAKAFDLVKDQLEIGDIAAAYVATAKTGPGDVYLYSSDVTDAGQAYTYNFRIVDSVLAVEIEGEGKFRFIRDSGKWIAEPGLD